VPVDVIGWDSVVARIIDWGRERVGRATYLCNVHVAVTASRDPHLARALADGDLVLPDGAPVAWMQRRLGAVGQSRIDGPNLMGRVCAAAERDGVSIYLLGGSPAALATLEKELVARFSRLRFVGLGCPKQELWIARYRSDVRAVMLGVGAAFDFHAKLKPRAPAWMQRSGLEWLHRLGSEPRRLWRRYAFTNSVFIIHAVRQLTTRRTLGS
jgi:N-acetylglucosaminyldiphosphoundecaprenol N-acetyl-beta-D-mannosaminyltransferase